MFVTAGSANPTSTIAALALRTAEHLVATRSWRPRPPAPARTVAVGRARAGVRARRRPPRRSRRSTTAQRARFEALADEMIPAAEGHPAPSDVGATTVLLDRALAARPDLVEPLRRALAADRDLDADGLLAHLDEHDPPAGRALRTCVAASYYMAPAVRTAIGYDGQEPAPVPAFGYPEFLEEGLLDHLL